MFRLYKAASIRPYVSETKISSIGFNFQTYSYSCKIFFFNIIPETYGLMMAAFYSPKHVEVYGYNSTGMRRITKFRSTTDRIYDGGPIIFYCNIYQCVTFVYSIQYSNMLYRFVA